MSHLHLILGLFFFSLIGCMSASNHQQSLHSTEEREMTVGIVQKEITKGMDQSQVAGALGSPNIVSKNRAGEDTWIYDKIATEASYSTDRGGIGSIGGAGTTGGNSLILGILGGSYSRSAGAAARTQKTLTVIITFNDEGLVNDFTYHSSKF